MATGRAGPEAGRALPPSAAGWVWPHWLHRQLDPGSEATLPLPDALDNRTGRNWTVLGVPDHPARWIVDGRGLLAPEGARWGLDWVVGGPDRWHVPAHAGTVRQRLVEAAPVVETSMRLRDGDVRHRCWAEQGDGGPVAWVEVYNGGADAVAVGVALRPFGPAGLGRLRTVGMSPKQLYVEGLPVAEAVVPARHGVAAGGHEDALAAVLGGRSQGAADGEAVSPDGWATAALVWPLAPRERLAVRVAAAVPAYGVGADRGSGGGRRRAGAAPSRSAPVGARHLPTRVTAGGERVAAGWSARADAAVRLELPAGRLTAAVQAVRRHVLLIPLEGDAARACEARRVEALIACGWLDEAAAVLEGWLTTPARGGRLGGDALDTAATLQALDHWRRAVVEALPSGVLVVVGRAAEHLARQARRSAPERLRPLAAGLGAAHALLRDGGEACAAAQVARWHTETIHRAGPLPTPPAWDPRAGKGTHGQVTLDAARVALAAVHDGRDPAGALEWLLGVASPTWAWPEVIDPRLGTGSRGSGHAPDVTAAFALLGMSLLASGQGDAMDPQVTLDLLPWLPPEWRGQALEVHGLPTAAGRLSFALRWHGTRPALLWELAGEGPDVALGSSGLDPDWSAGGRRGEALLGVGPAAGGAGGALVR